jgi:hypothetical protein
MKHTFSILAFLIAAGSAVAQEPTTSETLRGTLLAPKAFRAAADKVLPSLVTIEGFGGPSRGSGIGKGSTRRAKDRPLACDLAGGYILTSTLQPPSQAAGHHGQIPRRAPQGRKSCRPRRDPRSASSR